MKTISLYDKIRFFAIVNDLQEKIWGLERRIYNEDDRRQLNRYQNRISIMINEYSYINRLCDEYNRFINLPEQNRLDNLISFMKCMKRLGISPQFNINLNEEFDFHRMWDIINDDEKVVLSEDEFYNSIIIIDRIIDNMIEISTKDISRFSDELKNM